MSTVCLTLKELLYTEGRPLGLMLHCHHLTFLIVFDEGTPCFHFALDSTNYVDSPVQSFRFDLWHYYFYTVYLNSHQMYLTFLLSFITHLQ